MFNPELLMAALFACGQGDLTAGDTENFRQEFKQMVIGFTLDGWGGNPDFQTIAMGTDDFIPTGAWLDIEAEEKRCILPGEKGVAHRLNANCWP